jgi:hypothetical protein
VGAYAGLRRLDRDHVSGADAAGPQLQRRQRSTSGVRGAFANVLICILQPYSLDSEEAQASFRWSLPSQARLYQVQCPLSPSRDRSADGSLGAKPEAAYREHELPLSAP